MLIGSRSQASKDTLSKYIFSIRQISELLVRFLGQVLRKVSFRIQYP